MRRRRGLPAPPRQRAKRPENDERRRRPKPAASSSKPLTCAGIEPDTGRPLPVLPVAECPYCGSRETTLDNIFGPTPCRALYYCRDCRQPFESFKPV